MHSSKGRAGNHADQEPCQAWQWLVLLRHHRRTVVRPKFTTPCNNTNAIYHGELTVMYFVAESARFYFFCATVWPEIATCLRFTPCPMQSGTQSWVLLPESVRCGGCGLSTRYLASGDSSRLEFSKKYISRAHNSSKTFTIILFNLPVTFVMVLAVIGTFQNAREAISAKIPKKSRFRPPFANNRDHPQDRTHLHVHVKRSVLESKHDFGN